MLSQAYGTETTRSQESSSVRNYLMTDDEKYSMLNEAVRRKCRYSIKY